MTVRWKSGGRTEMDRSLRVRSATVTPGALGETLVSHQLIGGVILASEQPILSPTCPLATTLPWAPGTTPSRLRNPPLPDEIQGKFSILRFV